MNEEEKKAIELLENIKDSSWTTKYIMSSDSKNAKILLNLIEKQQKQIEKLIEELKQDDINMTRKYKEKKNITGELLGIDKVRVRAYREKTREINEKLHKLLIETIETKGE